VIPATGLHRIPRPSEKTFPRLLTAALPRITLPCKPGGAQPATRPRCFAVVGFCAQHDATVPIVRNDGSHESRASQVVRRRALLFTAAIPGACIPLAAEQSAVSNRRCASSHGF
jgi:hypothetical protein